MKKFIGRLLGYEQRLGHVLAQRDENARLAHARRLADALHDACDSFDHHHEEKPHGAPQ